MNKNVIHSLSVLKHSKSVVTVLSLSLFFLPLALLLAPSTGWAKVYVNPYLDFQIIPGWECREKKDTAVCRSTDPAKQNEAWIDVEWHHEKEGENLNSILERLKANRVYKDRIGHAITSELKSARSVSIAGQPWDDVEQLESESPGVFTRYLVTHRGEMILSLIFSVTAERHESYQTPFMNLLKSVRVTRKPVGIGVNGPIFSP